MNVRAEAGMYHAILGMLPLKSPLKPSFAQVIVNTSYQLLYLRNNQLGSLSIFENKILLKLLETWKEGTEREREVKVKQEREGKRERELYKCTERVKACL